MLKVFHDFEFLDLLFYLYTWGMSKGGRTMGESVVGKDRRRKETAGVEHTRAMSHIW